MKFSRFFIVLAAQCLLFASLCFAQDKKENKYNTQVWGYLVDDATMKPIDANITLMNANDSTVIAIFKTSRGDYSGIPRAFVIFTLTKPGNYIIKAEAEGYEPTYNNWNVPKLYRSESMLKLSKPWYIHKIKAKKDHKLGEVVVKATKVKFYTKGDTVVYNADAFELAEGSMLDALIKQLPGVELKEGGEITVNGRRVDELLLNGRDFLNSDRKAMLDNLPTYMVKNIKVFEKNNFMLEQMGDTITKNLAMDVRLKKEYSIGLIGNAEAGIGT
ncbi:MAG: carboxypeptidase regulatory-like domain-containing protein, partial [Bacteroidaceae bacterium]|nr:carboxypeptidase regulatory-like domain-containing protein [Bacteroidaceae bacterium]